MAESTPLEDTETGKIISHCRYFKMKVLESHNKTEVNDTIIEYINEKAIIFTDKSNSYVDFSELVDTHISSK